VSTTTSPESLVASLERLGPSAGWEERGAWLRELVAWTAETEGGERLEAFTAHLRARPGAADLVRTAIRSVLEDVDGLRLLAEAGLPRRESLADELLVRLVHVVFPRPPESRDLEDFIVILLDSVRWRGWPAGQRPESVAAFLDAVGIAGVPLPRIRRALAEAVRSQCLRAAAIGIGEDVVRAPPRRPMEESPFHRLDRSGDRFFEEVVAPSPDRGRLLAHRAEMERAVADSKAARAAAYENLERTGVSTDLVFRLDILGRGLDRIEAALPLLAPRDGEDPSRAVAAFVQRITSDVRREQSLRRLFGDRFQLLAKKIVERSGHTGSHYITADRAEWWRMFRMGLGGGLIIAGAVFVKDLIYGLHPPHGTLTVLAFLNYAAAFVGIHACHWSLATKQPPMTAAALADALTADQSGRGSHAVLDLVARIMRSQTAALLGNLLAAFGVCLGIDALHRAWLGEAFVEEDAAHAAIAAHAPFTSGSLFYAVLTGAAVWLSSMAAGWAENAAARGRLRESVAAARAAGGDTRVRRLGGWFVENIGGVAGNVSLAFFLVMITFGGKIFGVPVDVRHVTLATGQVALAASALADFSSREVVWAYVGLGMIGFLNIVTGFALALWIAMRARGVTTRARLRLLAAVAASPVGSPLRFLYPFGKDAAPPGAPEGGRP